MGYYYIPKDLIEDVEIQTGGSYDTTDLRETYKNTTMDLLELVITLKLNINDILKNPSKYKINDDTKTLLKEIVAFRNKKD